jgi:hypothetical protein
MVEGRREELRVCIKYLRIAMNGRRPLRAAGLTKKIEKSAYNSCFGTRLRI